MINFVSLLPKPGFSDLDCIDACWNSYYDTTKFDVFFPGDDATGGVAVGIRKLQGVSLVCFRGSVTAEDWALDFFAVPHPAALHPDLGMLHAGFASGMDIAFGIIAPLLEDKVVITGHSLGAARALIFGGMLQLAGVPPKGIVVFGQPKPGFQKLADILATIPVRSYKNMDDAVTHVPLSILDLRYVHPRALIPVSAPPERGDPWGFLGAHHCDLYRKAISSVSPMPTIEV